MNTAQVLVALLKEYGVEYVFGVPGATYVVPGVAEAMGSHDPTFIEIPTKSELEEVSPVHAWQAALQEESTPK